MLVKCLINTNLHVNIKVDLKSKETLNAIKHHIALNNIFISFMTIVLN